MAQRWHLLKGVLGCLRGVASLQHVVRRPWAGLLLAATEGAAISQLLYPEGTGVPPSFVVNALKCCLLGFLTLAFAVSAALSLFGFFLFVMPEVGAWAMVRILEQRIATFPVRPPFLVCATRFGIWMVPQRACCSLWWHKKLAVGSRLGRRSFLGRCLGPLGRLCGRNLA